MHSRKYQPTDKRRTVTVQEAAEMIGISVSMAYELISTGEFTSIFKVEPIKIGNGEKARKIIIPRAALERALDEGVALLTQAGSAK